MELKINVNDYLSKSDIEEIAKEAVRDSFMAKLQSEKDMHRILDNHAYHHIAKEVDKTVPNHKKVIADKVSEMLTKESFYSGHVFRDKDDYYGGYRQDSEATKVLKRTISESKEAIIDGVKKAINDWDYDSSIKDSIQETAYELSSNFYKLAELITKRD